MTVAADPVRSIRIAQTLIERFAVIADIDGAIPAPEMELRIGEAQQIYPEIWRHLDDARAALGVDVPAFDDVRAAERAGQGVSSVDTSFEPSLAALAVGRIAGASVKTVSFNHDGFVRARAACRALMAARPDVDWAALDRADAAMIARAGSLGPSGMSRFLLYTLIAGAVAAGGVALYLRIEGDREPPPPELPAIMRDEPARLKGPEVVERPKCEYWGDQIEHHLVEQFELVHDDSWDSHCAPGRFSIDGKLRPGFAFAVTAVGNGETRSLLGISPNATAADLVPYSAAPAIQQLAAADLDGDGADEIVFATAREVAVAKLHGRSLVTLPGVRCAKSFTLDDTSGHAALTIEVGTGPHCPQAGRHVYALTGDRLVAQ